MPTLIHQRVRDAQAGINPFVVTKMHSGWFVIGDHQALHGYCLLLPDPVVPDLNALKPKPRAQFLADMTTAGDILLRITNAARINYEILGNLEPALHAHIIPRYDNEDLALKFKPVWFYDLKNTPPTNFDDSQTKSLITQLRTALKPQ